MFEPLTRHLDQFLEAGVPGYDCIVYHKGKCVYRHWAGYRDLEKTAPMTGKELYNIYSCSKPITCTAVLQLVEAGKLGLHDPVSRYLPEFENMQVQTETGLRPAGTPMTVYHLLCMTAGLTYNCGTENLRRCIEAQENGCATREVIRALAKDPLAFEPGERWEYSLCHDVLAAVVEVVSGMRFSAYVKEHIFDVLSMKNSTYRVDDRILEALCPQFSYNAETGRVEQCGKSAIYRFGPEYESGGAGCVSTVDDYIRFLEALRIGNIILSENMTRQMAANQLTEKQRSSFWMDNYGYGLGVRCPLGTNEITDFGWSGAAGAYLMIDRQNEMTLFYAQQVLGAPVAPIRTEIRPVVMEILKHKENAI